MTRPRFQAAMCIYVLLALLAVLTLDGKIRLGILILLGGFAVKTWLAFLRGRMP